jgi:D-alanyl-D-alanine carboxypeptidase
MVGTSACAGEMSVAALTRKARVRGFVFRTLAVAGAAALLVSAGRPAHAAYSSIVIDADSGQVLAQHTPDDSNYPASLTKMMTLYLTFQGLEAGTLTLDQRFTVSAHAAEQAPSKLGLVPDSDIALKTLVFAVITHSANDAAVVIAENIAGSEPAFAQRMTRQAQALGMTNTHFDNASGLPDPANVTTARDLATLARALYRDFPREYPWFSTEEFTYNGVSYANHNHLMHDFAGMDGIKTGYIRASGFNLAASAVRDGRRLIAVVMGGESARSRDMKMAELLDDTFERPAGPDSQIVEDEAPGEGRETLAHQAGRALAALSPMGKAEAATDVGASAQRSDPELRMSDRWSIQVGTFAQSDAAERAAQQALQRLPSPRGHVALAVAPAHGDKDKNFRARIVHFTHHEARVACRTLQHKHKSCAVIAPDATQMAAAK